MKNKTSGQVIWITGLSGAGKTTVAGALCLRLKKRGLVPILLDGDILRNIFGDNENLDDTFVLNQRIVLAKKYSLLCKDLSSQGFIVIIATISMYKEIYIWNRKNLPKYFEIYLETPLHELSRRDPKNIYRNFSLGRLRNVAGLDLEVDIPTEAHLLVEFNAKQTTAQIVNIILNKMDTEGLI